MVGPPAYGAKESHAAWVIQRAYHQWQIRKARRPAPATPASSLIAFETQLRRDLSELENRMNQRFHRIHLASTGWSQTRPPKRCFDGQDVMTMPSYFDWEQQCVVRIQRWWRRHLRAQELLGQASKEKVKQGERKPAFALPSHFTLSEHQKQSIRENLDAFLPLFQPSQYFNPNLELNPLTAVQLQDLRKKYTPSHTLWASPQLSTEVMSELRSLRRMHHAQAQIEKRMLGTDDMVQVHFQDQTLSVLPHQREVLELYKEFQIEFANEEARATHRAEQMSKCVTGLAQSFVYDQQCNLLLKKLKELSDTSKFESCETE
jgi:hypothetical protein